jgi:hypothetical protein
VVTPEVPVRPNVKAPLGATAPVEPATVAVKISDAPKVGEPDALIETVGLA